MKQIAGGFRGSARRIVVAVVVGLAIVTAVSASDDSKAQSLQLPGVRLPGGTTQPSPGLDVPSVQLPPVRVEVPSVSLPGAPVKTPSVIVETPQVTTPSVQAPALPSAPIPNPSVPSPSVQAPSVQARRPPSPTIPDVRAPAVGEVDNGSGDDSASSSPPGTQSPATVAGSGTLALGAAAAARASLGLPSASDLRDASPARRREILRRVWDRPLRGERLRRLRETLLDYQGCIGGLPDQGRRTLVLRAGLGGAEPTSRRAIARRLGISLRREGRVERSALRRLTSAGEQGLCSVGASPGGGSAAVPARGLAATTLAPAHGGGAGPMRQRREVLGVVERDGSEPRVPRLDLDAGANGAPGALLVFMLMLLGPLGAVILATRRHHTSTAATGPRTPPAERPLLFLQLDGVLALSPTAPGLSGGRTYELGFGATYVSDRTRGLVRALASRFELVWTTEWEHRPNRGLLIALGLDRELPVLTLGHRARRDSAASTTRRVAAYAGDRPAAWIDDRFDRSHEHWAMERSAPTLLVQVDPCEGIGRGDVAALLEWADGLRAQEEDTRAGAASRSQS